MVSELRIKVIQNTGAVSITLVGIYLLKPDLITPIFNFQIGTLKVITITGWLFFITGVYNIWLRFFHKGVKLT